MFQPNKADERLRVTGLFAQIIRVVKHESPSLSYLAKHAKQQRSGPAKQCETKSDTAHESVSLFYLAQHVKQPRSRAAHQTKTKRDTKQQWHYARPKGSNRYSYPSS